ncbi:MAG: RNA polymerase sigma factor [Gammaproteobacteria bacterium]
MPATATYWPSGRRLITGDDRLKSSAAKRAAMDTFLTEVERRAFVIARSALGNEADALDVVQEAMIKLVRNYAARSAHEWRPLFYRILGNCVIDQQRKGNVRQRVMAPTPANDEQPDPLEQAPAHPGEQPERQAVAHEALDRLHAAVRTLPERQQQAFLLRVAEGLDVAQTAAAMDCSAGSVKTHYSRAVHTLRELLGEHWS